MKTLLLVSIILQLLCFFFLLVRRSTSDLKVSFHFFIFYGTTSEAIVNIIHIIRGKILHFFRECFYWNNLRICFVLLMKQISGFISKCEQTNAHFCPDNSSYSLMTVRVRNCNYNRNTKKTLDKNDCIRFIFFMPDYK